VKVEKQNLQMAELLIDKMEGPFDLSLFEDRYQKALQDLVEAKMKGQEPVVAEEPERPTNVVNLFDALKASVEGAGGSASSKSRARAKPSRKTETSRKGTESKTTKTKRRKRA
jgi:DNA end-binding protein Ku